MHSSKFQINKDVIIMIVRSGKRWYQTIVHKTVPRPARHVQQSSADRNARYSTIEGYHTKITKNKTKLRNKTHFYTENIFWFCVFWFFVNLYFGARAQAS